MKRTLLGLVCLLTLSACAGPATVDDAAGELGCTATDPDPHGIAMCGEELWIVGADADDRARMWMTLNPWHFTTDAGVMVGGSDEAKVREAADKLGGAEVTHEQMYADMDAAVEEAMGPTAEPSDPAQGTEPELPPFLAFGETVEYPDGLSLSVDAPVERHGVVMFKLTATNDTAQVVAPDVRFTVLAWSEGREGAGTWISDADGYPLEQVDGLPQTPQSRTMPGDSSSWWAPFEGVEPRDASVVIQRVDPGQVTEVTFIDERAVRVSSNND